MQESLIDSEVDSNLLNLVAVNTKRWRDANTSELRTLLCILYSGTYDSKHSKDFSGVDVTSLEFKRISRTLQELVHVNIISKLKEDPVMSVKFKDFLSDEEREVISAKSKEEGKAEERIRVVNRLLKTKNTDKDIAALLDIPLDELIRIEKSLGK